ncbi:MAG TPA: hypothetical protein EYQ00_08575 [Dehalococcoidia bacterium]|nr:hypothetical protein [Dehalococcoidia bacterium]
MIRRFNFKATALAMYAISGILGSALTIYAHCRRIAYMRREKKRGPLQRHHPSSGPRHYTYDAWRTEYDDNDQDAPQQRHERW